MEFTDDGVIIDKQPNDLDTLILNTAALEAYVRRLGVESEYEKLRGT